MDGRNLPHTGNKLPGDGQDGPHFETLQNGTGFLLLSGDMLRLKQLAVQVASSDAPILIHGETGTGKELFARLIHDMSVRARKPFVPVNCGVHEGELFADKFFGHEQGAFTGAHRTSQGCFELAGDGTLFLDEVGEIPPANQADFLRVLEERKYRRIGGQRDIPFQARIIAASNRELPDMVREGRFRADLFFRLNVIPVSLPPLRARREEIVPLARHFLVHYAEKYHRHGMRFRPETEAGLSGYPWPGNVRELKNLVERLALLAPDGDIGPEHLPLELRSAVALGASGGGGAGAGGYAGGGASGGMPGGVGGGNGAANGGGNGGMSGGGLAIHTVHPVGAGEDLSLDVARREAEVRVILKAMRASGGNKGEAARLLGVSPRTLRYKFSEYGLRF
ncbi:MAG TPA: sigma-54 dependent transcriptional regulator [Nitratidesulfovibrio sp.]|nr:sigma-54 dependent transcriptional regulator [Nitratidesulfovibrio sp.]